MTRILNQNIEEFLEQTKLNYIEYLSQEDKKYRELNDNMHEFLENLIIEIPNFDDIIDDFLDIFYQITEIENSTLYLQGYKDCYKMLKLLES